MIPFPQCPPQSYLVQDNDVYLYLFKHFYIIKAVEDGKLDATFEVEVGEQWALA